MSVDGLQVKKLGSSGRDGAGRLCSDHGGVCKSPSSRGPHQTFRPPASLERSGTLPRSDTAKSGALLW